MHDVLKPQGRVIDQDMLLPTGSRRAKLCQANKAVRASEARSTTSALSTVPLFHFHGDGDRVLQIDDRVSIPTGDKNNLQIVGGGGGGGYLRLNHFVLFFNCLVFVLRFVKRVLEGYM